MKQDLEGGQVASSARQNPAGIPEFLLHGRKVPQFPASDCLDRRFFQKKLGAAWRASSSKSNARIKLTHRCRTTGLAALLAIGALFARYVPAWRAARLQPTDASREE